MPQGNLHQYAVDAEENLEKLATGLAQAGADDRTVEAVSQMAQVTRKIVKALGKGQEQTGDQEPPQEEPREREPRSFDQASDEMMAEARQRRNQE